MQKPYSIKNIINHGKIKWIYSSDFLFFSRVSTIFELSSFTANYYSYGMVTDGNIILELDGEVIKLNKQNQAFLIHRPFQDIRVLKIDPGTKGVFIFFNKNFINKLDSSISYLMDFILLEKLNKNYFLLNKEDYNYLGDLFKNIFDLLYILPLYRWEESAHKLLLFLLKEIDLLLNKYADTNSDSYIGKGVSTLTKFIELVNDNYIEHKSIDFYAKSLNISSNYLYKLVKEQLNDTPLSYIQKSILKHAIFLLEEGKMNISEIAYYLLFDNVSTFSKFFKKKMHLSPSQYQRKKFY